MRGDANGNALVRDEAFVEGFWVRDEAFVEGFWEFSRAVDGRMALEVSRAVSK